MSETYQEAAWEVIHEVEKAVVGKEQIIEKIMTAILADRPSFYCHGHGEPGRFSRNPAAPGVAAGSFYDLCEDGISGPGR